MMEAITPTKQAENLELAESTIQTFRGLVSSTKKIVDSTDKSRTHDDSDKASTTTTEQLFAPWSDSEGYTRRLQTFHNAQTYFAKPLKLSPLVCARFGWENTGTDFLTCSCTSKCRGAIFVHFHPDLSPESELELVNLFRKMLATSHCDTCPFQMDSKRWLTLMDNNDRNNHKFVVPPYLIPMSQEFRILEDDSRTGFVTKEHIMLESKRLEEALAGMSIQLEHISVTSGKVEDQIKKYFDDAKRGEICSRSSISILDLLKAGNERGDSISKESALLALFGWRLFQQHGDNESQPSTNQTEKSDEKIQVMCKVCYAQCFIDLSDTNSCDQRGTKRARLTTSPAAFDMLNSHRHFCPLVSGFVRNKEDETNTSGTSRACWEVTLESVCRGYVASDNKNDRTCENVDDYVLSGTSYSGEETYQAIRKMMNASFLRK